MYRQLSSGAQSRFGYAGFASTYQQADATATATVVQAGSPHESAGVVRLPVRISTRVFGALDGDIVMPVNDGHIDWTPDLVLPGMPKGSTLTRRTTVPRRARIVARHGETIVAGPAGARSSPLGAAGDAIAGRVGPAESEGARAALYARGFERDTPVGLTGLEQAFDKQLAGTPGGALLAGPKTLASTRPRRGPPVRTTIDVRLQQAAVAALGARFGGVAALDPRSAEVRALAGAAFSAPQPPGSTFKIVTATAALEARVVRMSTRFPVETKAVIDGVDLENANGESCGGTFVQSFAHSCNSVFAPLGVKLGARRLVATAERYGFNAKPPIPAAMPSTLPAAAEISSPLEVGATAIGQGRVLATPLQLASMSQTVANRGLRRPPTLAPGRPGGPPVRVTSAPVARKLERLMIAVVRFGTGTAASLAPVRVAGKTGTAELEDTRKEAGGVRQTGSNTDAWFTAYAPVRRPRLAVAVLLVRAGAGGAAAAPVARDVLEAALAGGRERRGRR
jgi:cell division protein FtsI/penicillin-binding protein 2